TVTIRVGSSRIHTVPASGGRLAMDVPARRRSAHAASRPAARTRTNDPAALDSALLDAACSKTTGAPDQQATEGFGAPQSPSRHKTVRDDVKSRTQMSDVSRC